MARLRFALNHGKGRSSVGSGSELINGYAQEAPKEAKDSVFIVGSPGAVVVANADTSTEAVLAIQKAWGGNAVVFTDAGIYLVDPMGAVTRIGDGIPGPISTAFNGQVVVAVNGSTGIVVTSTSVSAITDPDFPGATTVQFILGFFVFTRPDSGQYFISNLYSTDFDALDFATAESAPDDTLAVVAVRREIWLLGEDTVEVHAAQSGGFPFAALAGVSINFGCVARFSALTVDQSVCWLSPDGIVYQSIGYEARRISTHEIEEELELLKASWADAFAWTYIEEGHQFYLLTVGEETFVFDFATRFWHKRETFGMSRHFATCCETIDGRVWVGDEQGRVHELDAEYHNDAFGEVVTVVGSVPYYADDEMFTTKKFAVMCEVGQGGEATLEYSDDTDGKTWSNRLRTSLGDLGEHIRRVEWRALGRSYSKRFRVRLYGNVRRRISSTAVIEVRK